MTGPLMTGDGHEVRVGDRLWSVRHGYALVTRAKVEKHWLTMHGWRTTLEGRLFVDERAALALMLIEAKQRIAKARADVRREEKNVERIKARLAGLER